ncbi:sugar ABC transporter ATP-binding protein [Arthrobacter cupressi]|uniref:Simple sugar transport system ATP-binding protein n=1 Tax=Arthrobacter cupressi TaxID=1045773 RepID=A0A1G8KS28_9MICC|nr:sugar ABC transporter ATP-binding protein [Arthrobacter cupressi]NYD77122.1 simple sugar transport system ATP-binding protein [Arthrobacter cupressi]SDI46238.1 simple sugar transport system ATP-binding protein [Arthrobacter cupressi]
MNEIVPVVEMTDISIGFPGVKALDGVGFRLFQGEVHALMGENGAGKSTLIKALTGVYTIDSGTITVLGETKRFAAPAESQAAGISTVYQEVNLCPNLTVEENVLLGREPRRLGAIDWKAVRTRTREVLAELHLEHVDPGSLLSSHSIAVQQLIAIARSVEVNAKVLILDEPTSSLDAGEVAQLFGVIRQLRDRGVAILFVSHFLEQVYEISDRMTVLRNGKLVGEYLTRDLSRMSLISKMIGKELEALAELDEAPARTRARSGDGIPFLETQGLGRKGSVANVDVSIHPGEVLGLAGLLGAGRTEIARLLFGADKADEGLIRIKGSEQKIRSPRAAIDQRIAFCSEDRKKEGLIGDLSVRDNLVLAMQASRGWARRIPRRTQDELVAEYIEALDIRPANPDALIRNLSGGNQQKVLLARWLVTHPELLILDEPTRGIDIGAKTQIQKLVNRLAAEGMSVLFISSELEEVLRVSDRVAVIKDRAKVAEINNDGVSVEDVMAVIAGGTQ